MGGHVSECEATSSQGHLPKWPIGCGSGMFNRKPFFWRRSKYQIQHLPDFLKFNELPKNEGEVENLIKSFVPKWKVGVGDSK